MTTTPNQILNYWENAHHVLSDRQRAKFLAASEIKELKMFPWFVVRTAVQADPELSVIVKRAWDEMTPAQRRAVEAGLGSTDWDSPKKTKARSRRRPGAKARDR